LNLDWLTRQPFVSTEMERRHILKQLRKGEHVPVPERLCKPAEDHINFELWRSGAVPNSVAPGMQDLAL
jgi:plasmid stability protein